MSYIIHKVITFFKIEISSKKKCQCTNTDNVLNFDFDKISIHYNIIEANNIRFGQLSKSNMLFCQGFRERKQILYLLIYSQHDILYTIYRQLTSIKS